MVAILDLGRVLAGKRAWKSGERVLDYVISSSGLVMPAFAARSFNGKDLKVTAQEPRKRAPALALQTGATAWDVYLAMGKQKLLGRRGPTHHSDAIFRLVPSTRCIRTWFSFRIFVKRQSQERTSDRYVGGIVESLVGLTLTHRVIRRIRD